MLSRLFPLSITRSGPFVIQTWRRGIAGDNNQGASNKIWAGTFEFVAKSISSRPELSPAERWEKQHEAFMDRNEVAGTAYSGRTESVTKHQVPLSIAWMRLNRTVRMNNLRQELRSQARFEKPGEKRRRLRSERWRRRFAEEVGRKIRLANAIRKRGS